MHGILVELNPENTEGTVSILHPPGRSCSQLQNLGLSTKRSKHKKVNPVPTLLLLLFPHVRLKLSMPRIWFKRAYQAGTKSKEELRQT
jgi:hypothetical protein